MKATSATPSAAPVLVVEDDRNVLDITSFVLESAGYPVLTAMNADEALAVLASHPEVGLVLTDVNMPGVEQSQVCSWIKAHLQRRVAPVVLYSGLPEEDLEPLARSSGADAFLTKAKGLKHLVNQLGAIFNGVTP